MLIFLISCQRSEVVELKDNSHVDSPAAPTYTDTIEKPKPYDPGVTLPVPPKTCGLAKSHKNNGTFAVRGDVGYFVTSINENLKIMRTSNLGKSWTTLYTTPQPRSLGMCFGVLAPQSIQLVSDTKLLISGRRFCTGMTREWVLYSFDLQTLRLSELDVLSMGGTYAHAYGAFTVSANLTGTIVVGGSYVPPGSSVYFPTIRRSLNNGASWKSEFIETNLSEARVASHAINASGDEVALIQGILTGKGSSFKGFLKINGQGFWKEIFDVTSLMTYGWTDLVLKDNKEVYFSASMYPEGNFYGTWKDGTFSVVSEIPKPSSKRYYRSIYENLGLIDILSTDTVTTGLTHFLTYQSGTKTKSRSVQSPKTEQYFGAQFFADPYGNLYSLLPDGTISSETNCN